MKKFISSLALAILLFSLISFNVSAAAPTVSISGPSSVRAGDTIKLNVYVNGTGIQYLKGSINYDANQLSYRSGGETLAGWAVDIENSSGKVTFLGVDDKLSAPVNLNKKLLSVTFSVKNTVAAGTAITVTVSGLSASDGTNDFNPAAAAYTRNAAAPLSGNNNLKSITVNNAAISPVFAPGTTSYSATVPFSVNKLEISAAAEDAKAQISVSNNSLNIGKTAVAISVTAENGSKKTYTINVTREQDPDYKEGGNADLKSITPDKGILSPVFKPEITAYNIYLPYESLTFNATGTMQDAKARGASGNQISLVVGANQFVLKGVAEDGTQKEYKITVYRMNQTGTSSMSISSGSTTVSTPLSSESQDSDIISVITAGTDNGNTGVPVIVVIMASLFSLSLGALGGVLGTRFKMGRKSVD